jgi:hypothetical protein
MGIRWYDDERLVSGALSHLLLADLQGSVRIPLLNQSRQDLTLKCLEPPHVEDPKSATL